MEPNHQPAITAFAALAHALEAGHVTAAEWEAANLRAIRTTLDDRLRVAIRDLGKAGERLLRARGRRPEAPYLATLAACREHLAEVFAEADHEPMTCHRGA